MKKIIYIIGLVTLATKGFSQNNNLGELHGNFQLDAQYYRFDSLIGTPKTPEKILNNGFLNLNYTRGNFFAGMRYEMYLNPLQGFSSNYKGAGIPFRYAGYKSENLEVTVGNFYEQYGNGIIFRSYEERNLGIDNAIEGIRLRFQPAPGVYLKGLIGRQRFYFQTGVGIVRGIDGEININEAIPSLATSEFKFTLGASGVSKYQPDDNPIYRLPENVGAGAVRATALYKGFSFTTEAAYKANDPSADNNFIYKPGNAVFMQLGYATQGLGITLAAKRIDNMSFRSDRNAGINDLTISFLPAMSKQHTYMLPSFYPYATQPNGEVSYLADIIYTFKKGSPLGGKYGTTLNVNFSRVYGLDTAQIPSDTKMAYTSTPFGVGRLYYNDINVEITKKFSPKWKGNFVYMRQAYNKDVVQGLAGFGTINSHIGVADVSYKATKKTTVRTEAHIMRVDAKASEIGYDDGHWAAGLLEVTIAPKYFVAVFDQWNYGNKAQEKQIHYVTGQIGYLRSTLRIALGYGRQRAGIICVGGVCRTLPASNGLTLNITSSF